MKTQMNISFYQRAINVKFYALKYFFGYFGWHRKLGIRDANVSNMLNAIFTVLVAIARLVEGSSFQWKIISLGFCCLFASFFVIIANRQLINFLEL